MQCLPVDRTMRCQSGDGHAGRDERSSSRCGSVVHVPRCAGARVDLDRLQALRAAGEVSMATRVRALILAGTGPLRDALRTLLASIRGIVVLVEAPWQAGRERRPAQNRT